LETWSNFEVRSPIRCLRVKGFAPGEIYHQLVKTKVRVLPRKQAVQMSKTISYREAPNFQLYVAICAVLITQDRCIKLTDNDTRPDVTLCIAQDTDQKISETFTNFVVCDLLLCIRHVLPIKQTVAAAEWYTA
jgi:hypothetical protein